MFQPLSPGSAIFPQQFHRFVHNCLCLWVVDPAYGGGVPNRLSASTSPYLRQHADNPVDWYEWGDEAFSAARSRDVPVLLSVGYSACHWCHVMAHESFEDPATAELMNRHFVNVKVDREERPDVDGIYMEAVHAMTGQGGWPMTVWLTPEGRPFYAGTYFPKTDRHGMPGFVRIIEAISDAWRTRRGDITEQAERLTSAIGRRAQVAASIPGRDVLEAAYRQVERLYDPANGGFGRAPKFPQQPVLEFLLRVHREPWAPQAGPMLGNTLRRMAAGGIYDQLGGGFARYSVDASWMVPHFEKMLYDNAQLARIYLWAGIELDEPGFVTVALETLEYLQRDLRHTAGGFFSAEDADSEGEEGKFYTWPYDEIVAVAGPEATAGFGVRSGGNFEGVNILFRPDGSEPPDDEIRRRLFEHRAGRVRPGLDHKVISAWNGLAIRAFAEAGAALERPDLVETARDAARFVSSRLVDSDGRLLRSWSEGKAAVPGFLDDHAGLAVGMISLYAATGESEWYSTAASLVEAIPRLFSAPEGGFFSTGEDAEQLITRPVDLTDNPVPSGNSLAAEALLLMSLYTGDAGMRTLAEGAVRAGSAYLAQHPTMVGHLLSVLHVMVSGTRELAVTGPEAADLVRPARSRFRPGLVVAIDIDGSSRDLPLLSGRYRDGETLAYVCENFTCAAPVSDPAALADLLG